MRPRFTLRVTDHELGKEMTIGVEEYAQFKSKVISGKSAVYELIDRFEEETSGQDSRHPSL